MNVLLEVSPPVLAVPEVALLPDHAPLAVQLVAFVEDQVRLELAPLDTLVGFALRETVGAGADAVTVTVVDPLALPPAPVQLNVNVPLALSAPVLAVPAVALLPDQAPLAVQLVALVVDQVRLELAPLATLVGFALNVTVGAGAGGTVVTVVEPPVVPPLPVQLSMKMLLAATSAPVLAEPDVGLLPDHAPLAVHEVALVEDHVRVELDPLVTEVGLALMVMAGAGVAAVTDTVADAFAEPPAPVHRKVKTLLAAVNAAVFAEPETARVPDHAPLAVQEVAFVEDQVRVEVPPLVTVLGLAVSVTVGGGVAGVTVTVADALADPPLPLQVRVKVLLAAVSVLLLTDPDVVRLPDHAPLAVQLLAFVEDHASAVRLPLATIVGVADSVTDGATGGGATVTVAELLAEPPAPVQLSVKVLLVAVRGPVLLLPAVAWAPAQAPEAVQESALVLVHVRVALPFVATESGVTVSDTTGAAGSGAGGGGGLVTVMVAESCAVPAAPVHDSVNTLVCVSGPTVSVPDIDLLPDHAPEAVHAVAFATVQVSVAVLPESIGLALEESETSTGSVAGSEGCASSLSPPQPLATAAKSKMAQRDQRKTELRMNVSNSTTRSFAVGDYQWTAAVARPVAI